MINDEKIREAQQFLNISGKQDTASKVTLGLTFLGGIATGTLAYTEGLKLATEISGGVTLALLALSFGFNSAARKNIVNARWSMLESLIPPQNK